jgi:nitrilase
VLQSSAAPFRVAAVQAAPVFLDLDATLEKACALIAEAGANGAKLVVFPEAFLPTYPFWIWFVPAGRTQALRELYAELLDHAVAVPSDATARLSVAAREAGVYVAMGINEINAEASGTTLYNSILYIGSDGQILGTHRKLVPTAGERLVHAQGDGSTLDVYDLPIGRLSGLICWENYMPLPRYALYAGGVEIYVAPTWDRGEPWISTLRHIAKEGRTYVIGCCSAVHRDAIPERYAFMREFLPADLKWINPGGSAIVDPDGKLVVEPVLEREAILYAEINPALLRGPRWQLDVAGHYARPDVFHFAVDRRRHSAAADVSER